MSKPSHVASGTLAVVGPGLIGASIGLAALERGVVRQVVGIGRGQAGLQEALERGAISRGVLDLAAGVAQADLVIVCTPVDAIPAAVVQALRACRPGAVVSDAGSVKVDIVRRVAQDRGADFRASFVGAHPVAGSDRQGAKHARANLFVDRAVVITPDEHSPPVAVAKLSEFWRSLGARVVEMSPDEHDAALAVTSHLPHLVAAAIAGSTPERYVTLTAGGWHDTTRVARGDPALWRQILLANREHVLAALGPFNAWLAELSAAVESQDTAALERLLAESKRIRDVVAS